MFVGREPRHEALRSSRFNRTELKLNTARRLPRRLHTSSAERSLAAPVPAVRQLKD